MKSEEYRENMFNGNSFCFSSQIITLHTLAKCIIARFPGAAYAQNDIV